jgi:hypothetical protein
LDYCLGVNDVPNALRSVGARFELHSEHFDSDTPDLDWLAEVGRRGWTVVTKDKMIRKRQQEMDALRAAGVAAFVLKSGNSTGTGMGRALVAALPRIRKLLRDYAPPFVAAIDGAGKVTMLEGPPRRASRSKVDDFPAEERDE